MPLLRRISPFISKVAICQLLAYNGDGRLVASADQRAVAIGVAPLMATLFT